MKHRLQTLLRHKRQWLVLLTALLGVGQGVCSSDIYYLVSSSIVGTYTVKANYNKKGDGDEWAKQDMSLVMTCCDDKLYKATIDDKYNGLGKLQIQLYDGDTYKSQQEPIGSWTTSSTYSNKVYVHNTGWSDNVSTMGKGKSITIKSGSDDVVMTEKNTNEYEATFYIVKSNDDYWFKLYQNDTWYSSGGVKYTSSWTGAAAMCTEKGNDYIETKNVSSATSGYVKCYMHVYIEYSKHSRIHELSQTGVSAISANTPTVTGSAPRTVGTTYTISTTTASGGSGSSYQYQFYINNSAVGTKSTSKTYSWTPAATGTYSIKVRVYDPNISGYSEYSSAINVLICDSPSTTDPATGDAMNVCAYDAPKLRVTGSDGVAPLTYQWYQNTENNNTSGSPVTDALTAAEGGDSYTPDAFSAGTPYYYYCVVRSAGSCATGYKATSAVSKQITIKDTPLLSPTVKTVKQYEPVKITSTNTAVDWEITTPASAPLDGEYYLYDETRKTVMFKGEYKASEYVITATPKSGSGCSVTSEITVEEDGKDAGCP